MLLVREQAESLRALEDFLEDEVEPVAKPPNHPHSAHEEPSRYVGFGNVPQKPESESFNAWSSLQSVSVNCVYYLLVIWLMKTGCRAGIASQVEPASGPHRLARGYHEWVRPCRRT